MWPFLFSWLRKQLPFSLSLKMWVLTPPASLTFWTRRSFLKEMNKRQLWEKYGHVLYFYFIFLWSKKAAHRKTKGELTPHFWDFFGWTSKSRFAPATGEVQRRPLIKFNAVLFFGEARWLSFTDGGREWVELCKLTGFGWIYIHRNFTPSLLLKIGWKKPKRTPGWIFQASFFRGGLLNFGGCTLTQIGMENDEGFQDVFFAPFLYWKLKISIPMLVYWRVPPTFILVWPFNPAPLKLKKNCVRDQVMESIQLGFSSWGGSLPKFFFI